jgi:AcrR family transcriptional regulator
VISGAISAFWAKGFDATTLADLEAATGVDRSTIYNSFGGKNGLYRSATAAYVDLSADMLFEPLRQGRAGVADIIEFLDRLADTLGSGTNPPGCLIVNDLAADTDDEAANRYLENLDRGLSAALERAAASNETDPDKTAQRSRFLTAAILGVNIAHRGAANDTTQAHSLIDGVRSEVASWAVLPTST